LNGQSDTYDFLTSTYGGYLPAGTPLSVVEMTTLVSDASLATGCLPLPSTVEASGKVVLVVRGGCRFDEKAKNIQDTGAVMVMVYDPADSALQRLGGQHPTMGFVRIPAVMVSQACVDAIRAASSEVTVTLSPMSHSSGFDKWIDVAYTEWAVGVEGQLLQIEGMIQKYGGGGDMSDIVQWLRRRAAKLASGENLRQEL
jgi:hypothetical protein